MKVIVIHWKLDGSRKKNKSSFYINIRFSSKVVFIFHSFLGERSERSYRGGSYSMFCLLCVDVPFFSLSSKLVEGEGLFY